MSNSNSFNAEHFQSFENEIQDLKEEKLSLLHEATQKLAAINAEIAFVEKTRDNYLAGIKDISNEVLMESHQNAKNKNDS